MKLADTRLDFKLTTDTPYLTLTGKLWVACCKDIERKLTVL